MGSKNVKLATGLSAVFTGLGYFYLGRTKKGTYLFFAALFIWLAIFTDKTLPIDPPNVQSSKVIVHTVLIIMNVTLWIYGVINSYRTARGINDIGIKICPFCGQKISIDETFCRFCRRPV
jgi:hypothetical protein